MFSRKIFIALTFVVAPGLAASAEALNPRSLHLSEVDQLVSEHNRSLVSARRATAAAEAGVEAAAARPNPTLSFNTSSINPRRPSGSGNLDTVVRLDQPIERGNKRELRLAVAGSMLEASRADESERLRQQQLAARQAYFDLKAAQEKRRLSEESAALAKQLLAKAQLRLQAGDLFAADVARIRSDALKAAGDAAQAQVDLQRARLALAQVLALESEAPRLAAVDDWPALTPLPDVAVAVEARPDVAAARQRLQAAERAIDLAKSQRTRDVTVSAQVERSVQDRPANTVGVGISIPLFTGYDYRGEIHRALVDRDQAQDELERLRALAGAEYAQAGFEAERLGERAGQLMAEALPSARKAAAAIQFSFIQGKASALDVIDARRNLFTIESDAVSALADAAKARAAWAAAVNRPAMP